jgi:hypothetical protein
MLMFDGFSLNSVSLTATVWTTGPDGAAGWLVLLVVLAPPFPLLPPPHPPIAAIRARATSGSRRLI